jgi:hypothetical protein
MAKLIGEHFEGDVRVQWVDDGDNIGVHYKQDISSVIDQVAAVNAAGGAQINDGLGVPKYEVPVTVAMAYCVKRGIPWEKFCYSNDYDSEWPLLAKEYSKLVYDAKTKFHTVGR